MESTLYVTYFYTCGLVSDDGKETAVTYDNYDTINRNYTCAGYSFIPSQCFVMDGYTVRQVSILDENYDMIKEFEEDLSSERVIREILPKKRQSEMRSVKNGDAIFSVSFFVPFTSDALHISESLWKSEESKVVCGVRAKFIGAFILELKN